MILLKENLFSSGANANADAEANADSDADAEAKLNEVIECVGVMCQSRL